MKFQEKGLKHRAKYRSSAHRSQFRLENRGPRHRRRGRCGHRKDFAPLLHLHVFFPPGGKKMKTLGGREKEQAPKIYTRYGIQLFAVRKRKNSAAWEKGGGKKPASFHFQRNGLKFPRRLAKARCEMMKNKADEVTKKWFPPAQLYGGTYRLMGATFPRTLGQKKFFVITVRNALCNLPRWRRRAFRSAAAPRVLYVEETPTNPTLGAWGNLEKKGPQPSRRERKATISFPIIDTLSPLPSMPKNQKSPMVLTGGAQWHQILWAGHSGHQSAGAAPAQATIAGPCPGTCVIIFGGFEGSRRSIPAQSGRNIKPWACAIQQAMRRKRQRAVGKNFLEGKASQKLPRLHYPGLKIHGRFTALAEKKTEM